MTKRYWNDRLVTTSG